MIRPSAFVVILLALPGCRTLQPPAGSVTEASSPGDVCDFVNPFIGTDAHGHTYPGATVPFGLVQLSPDTRLDGWDGCSGYHYSDSVIYGFSHTHLQGTGVSDYGDILFMPTNYATHTAPQWCDAYKSSFSHKTESASPGYYKVSLADYGIDAELTATERTGMHRYRFSPGDSCRLFIDMMHRDNLLYYDIQTLGDTAIYGFRVSGSWAAEQHCYFYAVFSRPFRDFTQLDVQQTFTDSTGLRHEVIEQVQVFSVAFDKADELLVKVGISGTDVFGAQQNLWKENPGWDFDAVRAAARQEWEKTLSRTPFLRANDLVPYYSALYHCYTVPNVWSDVDGRFRGMDNRIHPSAGHRRYTVFSLWDTFRSYHPLMCRLEPERTLEWIQTFLGMYRERGELPVWELAANETYCMIGYHSVPVIAEAYMRGIRGFDTQLALEAMVKTATGPQREKQLYDSLGYVPADQFSESVSKTLEFAYDDWCIAQFARATGNEEVYARFIRRAQHWKNLFDPQTGFMRPRRNGGFPEPFDPYQVDFNYTEANAWQYAFFVPHDLGTLRRYLGGPGALTAKLDGLFTARSQTTGREQADITGLIGQYAHGNEPSHGFAWCYLAGDPSRYGEATRLTEKIRTELYGSGPDGLCGNEDCGQMSAWYVSSMLDAHTGAPGTPPAYDGLSFEEKTARAWTITDYLVAPLPVVRGPMLPFADSAVISLDCAEPDARILMTVRERGKPEIRRYYEEPFTVSQFTVVEAIAEVPGCENSRPVTAVFRKREPGRSILSVTPFSPQYTAGGDQALVDGVSGGIDFRTGSWQGWQGKDAEVVVDLGSEQAISYAGIGCLQDIKSWIWYPSAVEIYLSHDGVSFARAATITNEQRSDDYTPGVQQLGAALRASARYVKVMLRSVGSVPSWHLGAGGAAWIFADEITIR